VPVGAGPPQHGIWLSVATADESRTPVGEFVVLVRVTFVISGSS